ncbi:MAG: toll/interleukin-1 receptor domain-containing protein [Nitrospirae bacterium]|nr:toll/interleukin-1 receptor domain-containing protein [Nitrospirota bacterium]
MAKTNQNQGVFISFHEENNKSAYIADELKKFFTDWKVIHHIVKDKITIKNPGKIILESIRASDCFLQIFTDSSRSEWMKKEWAWAKDQKMERDGAFNIIVLTTSYCDKNEDFTKEIKNIKKAGYRVERIDEEDKARNILSGILVNYKKLLKDQHGKIELPDFCKTQAEKEQIELGHVGEFIMNFIGAYKRGLKSVYPDRKSIINLLEKRLRRLRNDGGEVKMLGLALRRYTIPSEDEVKEDEGNVGQLFWDAINDESNRSNARLLLLKLECDSAKERIKIESPDAMTEDESRLFKASKKVQQKYVGHRNVKIGYYYTPYVGMVIFEDEAYVELYHLGTQIKDKAICGHVPIMLIKKNPDEGLYELFDSHFENVWINSKQVNL